MASRADCGDKPHDRSSRRRCAVAQKGRCTMPIRSRLGHTLLAAGLLLATPSAVTAQRWHGGGSHGGGWQGGGWHGGWHGGGWGGGGYGGWHGYYRPYGYGNAYYYGGYPHYGYGYPWFALGALFAPVFYPPPPPPPVYYHPVPAAAPAAPTTQQCPDGSTIAVGSYCPQPAPGPAPLPAPAPERGERG
jgi:hypothetical protein